MCGVLGFFGEPCLKTHQRLTRARVTEALLMANSKRGTDASGAAMVDSLGAVEVYKKAVSSMQVVDEPKMQRLLRSTDARAIIGHTRLGTSGTNTDRNAHPFREGTVTGAHNGMIYNHMEMDWKLEKTGWRKRTAVDSQVIFRCLSDIKDPGPAYANALMLLDGPMTLSWHDRRDPTALYLFAHENPLSAAIVPSINTLFWSSQIDHLIPALWAAYGKDWKSVKIEQDTLYRVAPDLHIDSFRVEMPKWISYYDKPVGNLPQAKKGKKKTATAGGQFPLVNSKVAAQIADLFPDEKQDPYLEECEMCGALSDFEYGEGMDVADAKTGDLRFLCGTCLRWWENTGTHNNKNDLNSAIEYMAGTSLHRRNKARVGLAGDGFDDETGEES